MNNDNRIFFLIAYIFLIILIIYFIVLMVVPAPSLKIDVETPKDLKRLNTNETPINYENKTNDSIKGDSEVMVEKSFAQLKGPYKIKGIFTIQNRAEGSSFDVSYSYLNIEGEEHTNSFTIGYKLAIKENVNQFFINASCKTADGLEFKFRNLRDDVYKQDAFEGMSTGKKCSFFYLRDKNKSARIRFAVIRPPSSDSDEIVKQSGLQYKNLREKTYIISYGFHHLDKVKENKEFTCTLNLYHKGKEIKKEFSVNYKYDI